MTAPTPARRLGFVVAAAIVVANMIGTGVFTSGGFQAAALHDPGTMMVAWVLGGVLALCGAAAYAELGAMMPEAGGEYVYLREAYHPVVGFLSGWVSLFAGFSAPIAGAALAFAAYGGAIFPALKDPTSQKALAVGLVVAMTALHGFDTVVGGRIQAGFSTAKAALIVVFIGAALLVGGGDAGHFAAQGDGLATIGTEAFGVSLMYVSFAYSGWNAAAYIAGDIREPARTIPRALLAGTALVTVLYVGLNLVFIWALGPERMATGADGGPIVEVGDAAARVLFGDGAGRLFSSMIALGLISAVSAMVMAGPRVYAAMADDGALPGLLAWRSARGVPLVAVLLQGAVATTVVLLGDLAKVMRYVGFTLSIFAALAVIAVPVLRVTRPDAPRPYRTWGYPVTPAIFVAGAAWITYSQLHLELGEASYALGTIAAGAVVWAASTWWHRSRPAS
ncbi:MAG: APC family permease [Kofleriaceae bacterium]|nr:APC family permease [Kofleriaceae bacterium]